MSTAQTIGHDIYLKTVNANTGKTFVTHHRAWDGPRFVSGQQRMHDTAGDKGGSDGCRVSVTDRNEYIKENWK